MASTVWVPVNASMRGFAAEVVKGASKAADDAGALIEKSFEKSGQNAGAALAEGVEKQTRVVAAARKAEAQAAQDVAVAEERLQQVRSSSTATASQVARAESDAAVAKAKLDQATAQVARGETDLKAIREGGVATAAQVARTEDNLGKARIAAAEASGKVKAADLAVGEQRDKVAAANEKVAAAEKKLQDARNANDAGSREVQRAERELETAKRQSDRASLALVKSEGELKKAKVDLANANDQVSAKEKLYKATMEDAAASQRKAAEAAGHVGDQVKKTGFTFTGAAEKSKAWALSLSGDVDSVGGKISSLVGTVGRLGGAIAGGLGVAGGAAFFGDAIGKGRELSQVMGSLQAVTGSTGDTMKMVSQRARDLGNDETLAGTSASSATDAMLALAKGGLSVSDAMDAAKGSIQLAGAAQVDAGTAADIQIAALNGFHLAAKDASLVADVLTNTANNSATGLTELGDSIKYTAPIASTLGVSLQDASTYLGLFANLGIKGSEAGTAMRSALLSLTNPSKEGAKALAEMGINAFDAQGKFVGMREITAQLAAAQDRMGESAFTAAAATAFGREAVSFATTAANSGVEGFDKLRASLDRQGSAGETAGAKLAGLNGVMDRIGNAIDDLQLQLYALAEPTLSAWGDRLGNSIGALTNQLPAVAEWLGRNKDLLVVIGGAVGGVVAGMAALRAAQAGLFAVSAISSFAAQMKVLPALLAAQRAGTLSATAAQLGLNTAMLINPIGLIVAGIAAVVGALVLFFTKTEAGKRIWGEFTSFMGQALQPVFTLFSNLKAAWGEITEAFQGGDAGFGGLMAIFGADKAQAIVDFAERMGVAFQNVKASIGELFAAFQGDDAGIGGLTVLFGADKAQMIADAFNTVGNAMEWIRGIITDSLSGTFTSLWNTVTTLATTLNSLGQTITGAVWGALQGLWNLLVQLWNLLEPVLMPVLQTIGIIVGGVVVGAILGAVKAVEGLAWILSQATNILSWIVTNGFNPLISVVGVVIQWVGNYLADAVRVGIQFLGDTWNAISAGIAWAWNTLIKPAWDALEYAAKFGLALIGTIVLTPLLLAWEALSWGIKAGWENVIKPAWDLLQGAANFMWTNVLMPIFGFIKFEWDGLSLAIRFAWDTIIKPTWDLMIAGITWLANNVFNPMVEFIKAVWNGLGAGIKWVFDTVVTPTWNLMQAGLQALGDFFSNIWNGYIKPTWEALGNGIRWVADNVVHPVFNGLKDGLTKVKDWFSQTVDNIGRIWDGIKEKTRKPVEFVVNTVYNGGIRKAWNTVAKLVGLGELPEHHFATGGVMPGYSPGKDIHHFYSPTGGLLGLSGGEAIMRPEVTKAMGGEPAVNALNKAAIGGGVSRVKKLLGEGAAFARGGVYRALAFAKGGIFPNGGTEQRDHLTERIASLFDAIKGEHGKPYQYGGIGNPSWDCSGLWSGIVQFLNGGSLHGGRIFNTESNFGNFGFVPGLSGRVTIGVLSGKGGGENGHMAGTIDGTNLESSGDNGVQIGGRARGSDNSLFNHTYTLKEFLGEFISGGAGGGGGFNLGAMVKGLWDAAINKIGDFPGKEQHGDFGKLPGAIAKTLADKAWDFIKSKVGTFSGAAGVAGNAESWREMAMAAMRRQGFNADDPAQVNAMLAQIQSESGGNPGIAQQIVDVNGTGDSAGVGLLQIIPGTFAANRDPELPNDRRDPWANMNAALRYYKSRYGTDLTTMWGHGHGYDSGGWLKPTPGGFGTYWNHTGKPEAVLTAEQWDMLERNFGDLRNAIPALVELGNKGPAAWKQAADALMHVINTGEYLGADATHLEEDHPAVVAALAAHQGIVNAQNEVKRWQDAGAYGAGIANEVFWKTLGNKSPDALAQDAFFEFIGGGNGLIKKLATTPPDKLAPVPEWFTRDQKKKEEEQAKQAGDSNTAASGVDGAATAVADAKPENPQDINPTGPQINPVDAAREELTTAFHGGDDGFGGLGQLIGDTHAKTLVNATGDFGRMVRNSLAANVAEEFTTAFNGGDYGYGATAGVVGEERAKFLVNKAADAGAAWGELGAAFNGGDDGFGGLASLMEDIDAAHGLVNLAGWAGQRARGGTRLYDQGGVLPHEGAAVNLSGKPEAILTNDQWGVLKQIADKGDGGQLTLVVNVDGEEVLRQRVEAVEGKVEVNTKDLKKIKGERHVGGAPTVLT